MFDLGHYHQDKCFYKFKSEEVSEIAIAGTPFTNDFFQSQCKCDGKFILLSFQSSYSVCYNCLHVSHNQAVVACAKIVSNQCITILMRET